jgi:alanine racemase
MRTGVVAFGLGKGMRRPAAGALPEVLVGGRRARLIGTSLEHSVVDLSGITDARVGDEAVFLGRQGNHEITLHDWASWLGCAPLEVVMCFGGRMPVRYVLKNHGGNAV